MLMNPMAVKNGKNQLQREGPPIISDRNKTNTSE